MSVSETELARSVPWVIRDATLAEVMNTLTTGTLLCAMAVQLGASNTLIGLIAGVAALFQVFQLAATAAVEKWRERKVISAIAAVGGRALWLAVAAVLLLTTGQVRLWALVGVLALRAALNAFYICASNSWMRDLIPDGTMGDFYARRMRSSYLAALITGLGAGWIIDLSTRGRLFATAVDGYAFLFVCAFVAGEVAAWAMLRVAEPTLPPRQSRSLAETLSTPLRDGNYRRFLAYLAAWNLTYGMATPLYTIFLLKRLGYSVLWVVVLETAGKLAHLATLSTWGRLADRHGSQAIVAAAQPIYWVSLLLWPVAGWLGAQSLLTPVLIAGIYVLNRVAAAGISIGNNTLAMQLAPVGGATAYLAVRSQVMNPVLFVAPLLAGLLADVLGGLSWFAGGRHLDAVLVAAALAGVLSAYLIQRVTQRGRSFADAEVRAATSSDPGPETARGVRADLVGEVAAMLGGAIARFGERLVPAGARQWLPRSKRSLSPRRWRRSSP